MRPLQFNDKFAEQDIKENLNDFDDCLSHLGRHLEQRFELEDQLIANLYDHHT